MKLIVGLGNPGKDYEATHHNAGWMFIDKLVHDLNLELKFDKDKECNLTEARVGTEKVILMQPTTYMNLSGNAVIKVINYYKIDIDDILVIFDDLDLEIGEHKIKPFGGTGGHRGLKSICEVLHTENIKRMRIGIGKPKDKEVIDYVLEKFSKRDLETIKPFYDLAVNILDDYASMKFDNFMNKYNSIK